jgi:hypothetical protein
MSALQTDKKAARLYDPGIRRNISYQSVRGAQLPLRPGNSFSSFASCFSMNASTPQTERAARKVQAAS